MKMYSQIATSQAAFTTASATAAATATAAMVLGATPGKAHLNAVFKTPAPEGPFRDEIRR